MDVNKNDPHVLVSAMVGDCQITIARKNLEYEGAEIDVFLFEPDYTIAGSTGFLLWPGTWVLIDMLKSTELGQMLHGKRVVELGSGTGLAGLCVAAAGASVLLTDLPSVVSGILDDNIRRNASSIPSSTPSSTPMLGNNRADDPEDKTTDADQGRENPAFNLVPEDSTCVGNYAVTSSSRWPCSVSVGSRGGSACSAALDWSEALRPQLDSAMNKKGLKLAAADLLLAVDVVWLKELLIPFRDTVLGLLRECRPSTPFLLTFLDRAKGAATGSFSSRAEVAGIFETEGCRVKTYHRQQVEVDGDQLMAEVMEITLICETGIQQKV